MTTSYQWRFVAIAVISFFLITTSSFARIQSLPMLQLVRECSL
jgi:hypothetical protein